MYGCIGYLWNKGAMYYDKEKRLRDIEWKDNYDLVPYLIFSFFSFLSFFFVIYTQGPVI